ncbi:hypothetical protein PIB30_010419 [Stylosanthes scabra]|uniref:Uncharacterized protein n=1 Tax=Stylosanthes scabra TaxID=79078 RepID=A0ABU6X2X1_9FABA|nr:hypothetical protein [Stylosanthes scabra]
MCALAEGGLPLRELSLDSSRGYGFRGISCLLRKCNNLQSLDLQRTYFLNDECVMDLSLLLGNLKIVKLSVNDKVIDLGPPNFEKIHNLKFITLKIIYFLSYTYY